MARDLFPVVVHVLLVRGGRLFMLRRANTGFMDGYFVLPGGHQHGHEGVREAALRECLEETGAKPATLEPVCVMPYRSGSHRGLNFLFEATAWDGEPSNTEPAHCAEAGWFPLERLPEPYAPWIPDALRLRRQGVWFAEYAWH
jgi:8-oxo-dGTP diphosphatase